MKKLTTVTVMMLLLLCVSVTAQNQDPKRFSPERFQADLEQYITEKACLTPQEAAKFFPVYREMQAKLRVVFDQQMKLGRVKPADEKGCAKAIRQRDEYDLEQKRILQSYHNKFLSVLSASKLYDVLKAEDRFHRKMLRGWNHSMQGNRREKK